MRFQDKVAILTGGSGGIGATTAQMLAKEGAKIAIFDVHDSASIISSLQEADVDAIAEIVDITNATQVQEAVARVHAHFGRIDILINCAGVLKDNLIHQMTENDWDFVVDVNLKGSYLMCQAVQPYMVEAGAGNIVLISSQAAIGAVGRVNYSAAKAGVQGITRTLSMELGPKGIHVNAIAPGFIDTEMSLVSAKFAPNRGIADFQKAKEAFVQSNPIRRTGKPEDVAYAILFLASEQASYITGQVLYVTGAP
ncbi:SDR family NAD(P)-dependent oxidoreductase [Psychrobacillus sp. NPDC096426]|uniref:SDR family NAD(P)-dependent oxidoreductase n=1 Tax=Psychrobacillus sp. NPDC096426 TaxID=3364491 RepID=UPI0038145E1B